jgi:hypothetical protein
MADFLLVPAFFCCRSRGCETLAQQAHNAGKVPLRRLAARHFDFVGSTLVQFTSRSASQFAIEGSHDALILASLFIKLLENIVVGAAMNERA